MLAVLAVCFFFAGTKIVPSQTRLYFLQSG